MEKTDTDPVAAAIIHALAAGRLSREAQRLADIAEFHSACARAFLRDWLAEPPDE